ncbi:MAG: hypothetical protein AAF702_46425 [Chloroflexota bacterium]
MEHLDLYHQIVDENNHDQLHSILDKHLSAIGYELVQFDVLVEGSLPYLYCQIRTDEIFSAQMIGLFAEIDPIIPDYPKPYYYLPIVVYCEDYDERIKSFIDNKISLEHELQHVKDMLALIQQDPDYPERSYRYGMNSVIEVEDLPISIDLEIGKLLYIEPTAMKMDFEKGEKSILYPFDEKGKSAVRYDCDSVEEYVGLNIHSYLTGIKEHYNAKFENDEIISQIIDQEIDKALTYHGKDLFGQNPVEELNQLHKRYAPKFFLAMLQRQFV